MNSIPADARRHFARAQQGIIFFLGAVLVALLIWHSGWGRIPTAPPAPPRDLYFVEIRGAVARPGIYRLFQPPDLRQLWSMAGGPGTPPAHPVAVASGSRISIAADGSFTQARMAGADLLVLGLALDLNRASASDLEAVPGIGPVLATRIVEYRQTHGPFGKLEDLVEINGIGPENFEKIRPYLEIPAGSVRSRK